MRRFSQRNSLVTLSDINITPLLDLAFVLLIIFIITTPLLEKGLDLKLPKGGQTGAKIDQKDIRTVEIDPRGIYSMNKRPLQLNQLVAQLVQDYRYNPKLVVYIRADENSRIKEYAALVDACTKNGISRFSLRYQSPDGK